MSIYHYTTGYAVKAILQERFIALEGTRGKFLVKPATSYVWFTTSNIFPRTALPGVSGLPYSLLQNHLGPNKPIINWEELSDVVGGVYRFAFDNSDHRLKKWKFCSERKALIHEQRIIQNEKIARKVGDDLDSFYISESQVKLTNCKIQRFENRSWIDVLELNADGEILDASNFTIEEVLLSCSNNKIAK